MDSYQKYQEEQEDAEWNKRKEIAKKYGLSYEVYSAIVSLIYTFRDNPSQYSHQFYNSTIRELTTLKDFIKGRSNIC